jgi:hypothetical protein
MPNPKKISNLIGDNYIPYIIASVAWQSPYVGCRPGEIASVFLLAMT